MNFVFHSHLLVSHSRCHLEGSCLRVGIGDSIKWCKLVATDRETHRLVRGMRSSRGQQLLHALVRLARFELVYPSSHPRRCRRDWQHAVRGVQCWPETVVLYDLPHYHVPNCSDNACLAPPKIQRQALSQARSRHLCLHYHLSHSH